MFAGFFILLFIGVNTGNILLYSLFSRTLMTELSTSSQEMLTKVKNATELMYSELISFAVQLGSWNITITNMMFEKERDRLLEYQGYQIMRTAMLSYPYIDYLAIYNERLDEIFGTRNFLPQTTNELKRLANYYFQQGSSNLTIPLDISSVSSAYENPVRNTITIIVYSPLALTGDKGALLVGISCDYFQQLIRRMDEGNLETVMILHGNGQVISHPDKSEQLKSFRNMEYLEPLYRGIPETRYYIRDINSIETHITYTRSSVLDWTFVSMIPWRKMASKLIFLRNITLLITLVVLCAGFFISYLMAIKMYRPVQRILKHLNYSPAAGKTRNRNNEDLYIERQIDYLRSTADMSETLIRGTVIFDLLTNQSIGNDIINTPVIERAFREPYYMVCVFSWDRRDSFECLGSDEQGLLRDRLIKIALEMTGKACVSVDHAVISSTDIALVLHLEIGTVPDSLGALLAETVEMVKKFYNRTVSATLGSIVSTIFAINDSFEEAQKFLKERFFLGAGTVIVWGTLPQREETVFPVSLGEELYQAILDGDSGKIRTLTGQFEIFLGRTTYEYVKIHLNVIIMQFLSFCLLRKLFVDANSFHILNGKIQNVETLGEACGILTDFCLSLAHDFSENPADSPPPLVREAFKLAEEKYQDPLFSINVVAELFNITPAYFNRVFKKYKHISYSEFLNEYRMEKACKLLLDTNVAVIDIIGAVGFGNTNYFYTLFKKLYKHTPQQHRNMGKWKTGTGAAL
jgi:AraC-like DNA-binding protein